MNEQEMKKIAEAAAKNAYAPYSGYSVGAALETKSGKVYSGCNVENASYGLTNCAERTAVFKAVSEGEQEFEKILIFADSDFLPTPCGACRQVLAEFGKNLKVVMISRKERKESTIAELLPLDFQFQKK